MKSIFPLLFSLSTLYVNAQKNIFNISFQDFFKNKQNQQIDSTYVADFSQNKSNTLPYFQYIHFTNNELGFGVQFSYQAQQFQQKNIYATFTPDFYRAIENKIQQNAYLLALSIHEKTKINKYTILTSVFIPFEYYKKSIREDANYEFYIDSPLVHYNAITSNVIGRPSVLIGLYYQLNIYRKIYRGLNATIGINTGIDYMRYFGYTIQTDMNSINNTQIITRYKTSKTYQINVALRPLFGISYFF